MTDSEEGDRLENLLNLGMRYVIVPLIPRMELLFSWQELRSHGTACRAGTVESQTANLASGRLE